MKNPETLNKTLAKNEVSVNALEINTIKTNKDDKTNKEKIIINKIKKIF